MSFSQTVSLAPPDPLCEPPPLATITAFLDEVRRRGHVSAGAIPFGVARYDGAPVHVSSQRYEKLALDAARGELAGGVRRARNLAWDRGIHDVTIYGELPAIAASLDTPDYTLGLQSEGIPPGPTSLRMKTIGLAPVEVGFTHAVAVTVASEPFSIDPRLKPAIPWGARVGQEMSRLTDVPADEGITDLPPLRLAAARWAVTVHYGPEAWAADGVTDAFLEFAEQHFGHRLQRSLRMG